MPVLAVVVLAALLLVPEAFDLLNRRERRRLDAERRRSNERLVRGVRHHAADDR
jgi:hypothetical protein